MLKKPVQEAKMEHNKAKNNRDRLLTYCWCQLWEYM